jgi:hypothetical protein
MNLENIIAVSGMSGLYKVVGQTKNGLVIESLEDKKRIPIYATNKVSALEDICIYTDTEEKPLAAVISGIFSKLEGKEAIDFTSPNDKIKAFFEVNMPDYDRDRVYVSDMKKVLRWYNTLHSAGLIIIEDEKKDDGEEKKPVKKAAAKKTTATIKPGAKKAAAPKKAPVRKVAANKKNG